MYLLIYVPRVTITICWDLCPLADSHFIIVHLFLFSFYPQGPTNTTIMKMIPGTHFHHGKHNVIPPVGSHIAWGTCGCDDMVEADEILYGSISKARCCCQTCTQIQWHQWGVAAITPTTPIGITIAPACIGMWEDAGKHITWDDEIGKQNAINVSKNHVVDSLYTCMQGTI